MIGLALTALGFALLAFVAGRGRRVDRWAVGVVIFGTLITPVLQGPQWENIRWAVALMDVLLLVALFSLANLDDRWWLLNLCSLQFMAVITHVMPLLGSNHFLGTAVTIRILIWGAFMLTFAVAIVEIEIDRRLPSENANA